MPTPNRVQTLRSSVKGQRPAAASREAGELYVNFPDRQAGFIDASKAPVDLVGVRFFSTAADYVAGDFVAQGGQLYRAKGAVSAGAFAPASWDAVVTFANDGAGSGLDADLLDGNDSAYFVSQAGFNSVVAGLAPIASPTFTGDPKAPTPATADNDTSIATTAFVKAQGYISPDAPSDSSTYGRRNGAWAVTAAGLPEAPNDANAYVRSALAWVAGYTKAAIDTLLGTKAANTAEARNRIINPAMSISQENGDTAVGTGTYPADHWAFFWVAPGASIAAFRSVITTPRGSPRRLRANIATAKASLAAGDYLQLTQTIEGLLLADLQWGTVNAKPIVLRFGARGPAGTYSVSFRNGGGVNRCYIKQFTIAATGVDQEFVFSIPGDTTGSYPVDNSVGLYLSFVPAAGANFIGVANAWQAGGLFAAAGQSNGIGAVGTFDIFDIGLYADPGNTGLAPAWQYPNDTDELQRCMRYWQQCSVYWSGASNSGSGFPAMGAMLVQPRAASLSAANLAANNFPTTPGTLVYFQPNGVRETRSASASSAASSYGSTITVNARMM